MKAEGANSPADHLLCSVIIPTWQRCTLLRATLESLAQQSYPRFEVIVVCDGEDAATLELAREYRPNDRVRWSFHSDNRGQAAARNSGAREASGEILLFLDDDVTADPELIAHHLNHHFAVEGDRHLAVVGRTSEDRCQAIPRHTDDVLQKSWEQTIENYANSLRQTGSASIGAGIESIIAFGLNCSIRRTVFLSTTGFNERFRITDEDTELGLRLYSAGIEFIYENRAVITHHSTKDLTDYYRRCWGVSGKLDVYRVFELEQKNEQTKRLAAICHGYLLDRLTAYCCWKAADGLRSVAGRLEDVANRTGSRPCLGAWARACQAGEYWANANAAGFNLERLKAVVRPPKRALLLHSVSEPYCEEESSYYISPTRFRRFMRWFRAMQFETTTIANWIRDEVPKNHVLLTFDDAYDDLYDELLPVVIEHRYTPVIYLVAEQIGGSNAWDVKNGIRKRNLLTLSQIREMRKYGVEFGSHTLTHPWLPSVSDVQLRRELHDSKHRLEDMLGVEITSFAYPFGGVDRRVRSAVAEAGYKLAFTTIPGANWWNDPLCQLRAEVNDRTTFLDFTFKLRSGDVLSSLVSARLRNLQQNLPTRFLRTASGQLRSVARRAFYMFNLEITDDEVK